MSARTGVDGTTVADVRVTSPRRNRAPHELGGGRVGRRARRRRRALGALLLALAILFVVLLLPAHPRDLDVDAFLRVPLELPAIVLALLALPVAAGRAVRLFVVAAAGLLLLLRLADLGSRLAFDRPFSPLVELHLLGDGWNLASQSVGRLEAGLGVAVAFGAFALLCTVLYRGLGGAHRLHGTPRRVLGSIAAVALTGGLAVLLMPPAETTDTATTPTTPSSTALASLATVQGRLRERVQADLGHDIVDRVRRMRRSIADQRTFVAELAADPLANAPPPTFDALAGRDVAVVFVESYGRSVLDGERFRTRARARLADIGERIEGAGLHARSAWLTSPIRGGRSWLAHATFASGLEIGDQARFDRLLGSSRKSLVRLFGEAGWRTAGLMPAIRLDWPEGAWYGFDDTRDFHTLGYAGEPFGWVTMPDQYTLSAFEHLVRRPEGGDADAPPVMAEIALISSHAPWTPLSRTVPWDAVGDGSVFDGRHRFGDEPAALMQERELLREHFALSIDYSLEVIGGYLERHGAGALFVILGDHQPASVVDGWDATADVPVHVVADDPALLARLPDAFWTDGMLPGDASPSRPMASMRETLARVFSGPPANGPSADGPSADGPPELSE